MQTVDFIRLSLEMSKNWIMGLAADMANEPMAVPTPNGGNHPLWCVGHMAYAEANLVNVVAQGKPHPFAEWKEQFDVGSTVQTDPSVYPSFEEVMGKFEETRAGTMAYLNSLSDADLDQESKAEGEMQEWFGTVGHCLAAIPIHLGFHGGQIADARRAAGRAPLMG